jgi:threonyl-tRNA synthetase
MSCPTGRCALRRFDGHGTPYKPTNTMASKQMADSLSRMMAERDRQDAGHFAITNSQYQVVGAPVKQQQQQQQQQSQQQNATFYSLSDTS